MKKWLTTVHIVWDELRWKETNQSVQYSHLKHISNKIRNIEDENPKNRESKECSRECREWIEMVSYRRQNIVNDCTLMYIVQLSENKWLHVCVVVGGHCEPEDAFLVHRPNTRYKMRISILHSLSIVALCCVLNTVCAIFSMQMSMNIVRIRYIRQINAISPWTDKYNSECFNWTHYNTNYLLKASCIRYTWMLLCLNESSV